MHTLTREVFVQQNKREEIQTSRLTYPTIIEHHVSQQRREAIGDNNVGFSISNRTDRDLYLLTTAGDLILQ